MLAKLKRQVSCEVIAKIEKRLQDCITMHEGEGQAGLVSGKPGRCLGKTVNN
jgi:hypothetical protein